MPKGSGKPIPKVKVNLEATPQEREDLLQTLKDRFEANMHRHEGLDWSNIEARITKHPEKLASLFAMEDTGGEPDVVGVDEETGEFLFFDCSEQSPAGRRSISDEGSAQQLRQKKGVFPGGNAVDIAAAMGVEILDESQYRRLQELGEFDTKTESWIKAPEDIRALDGAVFADRRYGHVFVFHNSAHSFYASRGFRGVLRV
jgi:hypothetical protein